MSNASWKNAAPGSWGTAADWTPTAVPNGSSAEVTIAANGVYAVTIGTTQVYSVDTLTIGNGPSLDLLGTLAASEILGGNVVIGHGGMLELTGTLAASVTNDGLIEATHNAAVIAGTPTGSGNLAIGAGATLELTTADSERVVFTGTAATLLIGDPAQFTGTISGFEQSDTIALAGVQASGVTVVGDALDVLSGDSVVTSIALPADYSAADFSVVQSGHTALISETGITYAVEGPTWNSSTLTWSFADTTYADDGSYGEGFTNYVTQSADQAIIEQALADWSAVTGLTFVEIPDTTDESEAADIRIGWADFGSGGEIGEADYSYSFLARGAPETFDNDVLVRLEDPAADPLDSSSGTAIYSGTESSLMQVALHELGHSLGLDHTPDPNAIMNPVASSANRQLDASDIAAGQALYAGDVACYAAGTRIRARRGEVPVERLRPGDRVLSALSGAWVPVVWTGHRTIACARHPTPAQVRPVQVCAGAFAPGIPARDLLLSPDHCVRCGDALVVVRALLNGGSIRQLEVPRVTYWHVELPSHDVILAEGLAAESYRDAGNRASFVEHDTVRLHSVLSGCSSAASCLPLLIDGPAVASIRRRLALRMRGREAATFVRADGTPLSPVRVVGARMTFLVPAGVAVLALDGARPLSAVLNGRATALTRWSLRGKPAMLEVVVPVAVSTAFRTRRPRDLLRVASVG